MILRSPTENENAAFVIPAWIAGIQVRKDASEDVHENTGVALRLFEAAPPRLRHFSMDCWNPKEEVRKILEGRKSFWQAILF